MSYLNDKLAYNGITCSWSSTVCRVSDAGIRHVIENAPGSVLRELNITNLIKISDVTLLRMSQR